MIAIWKEIANDIHSLHPEKKSLPLHEPTFGGREKEYVNDCIETGWVSSVGKYVDQFERELAAYVGVKRAVAVVNGTAALHIALKIAGVQPKDEVLIPSLTFVATANAVSYLDAAPHFVDVSKETLGLDPMKLDHYLNEIAHVKEGQCVNKATGNVIRAVVPMHTFGHPVDLDPLLDVCRKYHLALVEDAAESLGSSYKGKQTGCFGKAAALSFNGNKTITTGGGGAILTNDESLADYAKHITTTAKLPHPWRYEHDEIGFNYRMPNLNAALGCAQLEQLEGFVKRKRNLAKKYKALFASRKGIEVFEEPSFARSNYWLQTMVIDDELYSVEDVLDTLNHNGIMARPIWTPLHTLSPYQYHPRSDLSITEKLSRQIVNIPSSSYMGG